MGSNLAARCVPALAASASDETQLWRVPRASSTRDFSKRARAEVTPRARHTTGQARRVEARGAWGEQTVTALKAVRAVLALGIADTGVFAWRAIDALCATWRGLVCPRVAVQARICQVEISASNIRFVLVAIQGHHTTLT